MLIILASIVIHSNLAIPEYWYKIRLLFPDVMSIQRILYVLMTLKITFYASITFRLRCYYDFFVKKSIVEGGTMIISRHYVYCQLVLAPKSRVFCWQLERITKPNTKPCLCLSNKDQQRRALRCELAWMYKRRNRSSIHGKLAWKMKYLFA